MKDWYINTAVSTGYGVVLESAVVEQRFF